MDTYEEIFNKRGYQYDQAMIAYPNAREQEFKSLVSQFHYLPGSVIADIPAGGEYLKKYLPADCHYVGFEPCHHFKYNTANPVPRSFDFFSLPLSDQSVDIVFSIAGLHHLEDKTPVFSEFERITKRGGQLGIADVYHGTSTAKFLDQFVGEYNQAGHEGIYLSDKTLDELHHTGWIISSAEHVKICWLFDDTAHLGMFCQHLFNLECTPDKIIAEVENNLGLVVLPNNRIGMNWDLYRIIASCQV